MAPLVELRPRHFLQAGGGAGSLVPFCLSVGRVCCLSAASSFCVGKTLGQTTTGGINRRTPDGLSLAGVQTQQKADLSSCLEGR